MITDIILLIFACAFILAGNKYLLKVRHLKKVGKTAVAIVMRNNYKKNTSYGSVNKGYYYPVVRFTTESGDIITKELNFGRYPPMSEGGEIELLYDPANPREAEAASAMAFSPWLFIAIGVAAFILATLELLEITNLIQ
ncbi:hypothetical protein AM493_15510 [Flavobacterium akiainvivens]|uniref:DUF3592 domain-containing protein n=1 Tax=Flavobacterium akiainvivens TaxID=1202724 RepID=A0A0M8MKB6_9FLAO|nr:DUF3592 domain-containing protein [Flavobacterium akiainvivens]KOS07288.1 hypothetical protein AM493_15510 [Flavobacterium akiainvivens]SFQ46232.1 Protein of unknown function [Flavobacterium akiainvivens]